MSDYRPNAKLRQKFNTVPVRVDEGQITFFAFVNWKIEDAKNCFVIFFNVVLMVILNDEICK